VACGIPRSLIICDLVIVALLHLLSSNGIPSNRLKFGASGILWTKKKYNTADGNPP
jgi:hypothetical protein